MSCDDTEYRALNAVLRRRGRVHQSTPNLTTRAELVKYFAPSAGRFRAPLKTTLIAGMDVKADRTTARAAMASAWIANTVGGARFRWQHLPCRSRCTPTEWIWWCSRSSGPAAPHSISGTPCGAVSCSPTGLRRMVNRNDRAVAATVVGGRVVYEYGEFAPGFGTTLHAGSFLTAHG
ncbi:hypothetical protein ACWELJ_03670 [Nocardia sp. NPDC004582]